MPWRARDFVHYQLRRQAGRPQLKRDPLGGNPTVSTSAVAKWIPWYETGAGLGGLYILAASGAYHANGPLIGRILLTAFLAAYCLLLMVAGIFLMRRHSGGVLLSRVAQSFQIPQVTTHVVTYSLFTPLSLVLSFKTNFDIGLEFNIAAECRLLFGHTPDVAAVGVNLLPLVVLYLLRRHGRLWETPVVREGVAA